MPTIAIIAQYPPRRTAKGRETMNIPCIALVTFQAAWNSLIFSVVAPSPPINELSDDPTLGCLQKYFDTKSIKKLLLQILA